MSKRSIEELLSVERTPLPSPKKMATNRQEDVEMAAEPSTSGGAAAGARGGDQGGQAAGGDVGVSTGMWVGGTSWGDNHFKTRQTRQVVVTVNNDHLYKRTVSTTAGNSYIFVDTPWRILDFNCYACHMNPQDYQRLINTASHWRPKSLTIHISNVQLKTKIATTPAQIQNNLTATMQILIDGSHEFPRSLDPLESGKVPFIPTEPYYPPGYAYFVDDNNGVYTAYSSMYILEAHTSKMARCGDSESCHFQIDSPWIDNRRISTNMSKWYNPKVQQLWGIGGDTGDKTVTTGLYRRTIWRPGPFQASKPATSATDVGTAMNATVDGDTLTMCPPNTDNSTTVGHNTQVKVPSTGQQTADFYVTYRQQIKATVTNAGFRNVVNQADTATVSIQEGNLMNNQLIEYKAASFFGPIWIQRPDVDASTLDLNPFGIPTSTHTPGKVLVKVTPQPTDTVNSFENVYATFTLSYEMEWEYKPFSTKRWNPLNLYSYAQNDATAGVFLLQANNAFNLSADISSKQLFKYP